MKFAPRSWKRPVILLLLGAVLIVVRLKQTWWRYPSHLYDEAHWFDRDQRFQVSSYLAELAKATGADVRVIITRSIGDEPIAAFALRRMRKLGVGETTDRRGILVVLDLERKRARVEVGPKLEGIITDAYSGYLAHDVLTPMLTVGTVPRRVMSILYYTLRFRIDEGILGQEWDPAEVTAIQERQRLALGGGAGASATLADLTRLGVQPAPGRLKAYYRSWPTATQALAQYQEWLQEPFAYADVDLLSDFTKEILTTIDNDTPVGSWRFDQVALSREHFVLVERGVRAIGIPTVSPLTHPVWLVKDRDGWKYELAPEYTTLRSVDAGAWRWTLLWQRDPWINDFADLMVNMPGTGVYRFQQGNNTPLPGRGSYR
jgi:TLP18.3/Psb32/MOLO-1 phosphatase superfamily protein